MSLFTSSNVMTHAPADLYAQVTALEPQIGHTPLLRIRNLFNKDRVAVYAKQEWMQMSGSVKARAAFYIVRDAVEKGLLTRRNRLLDATSGNTGIAYAHLGRALGIPVTLCLPENASAERKEILLGLGAELILTSRFEGTDGAQQKAQELMQTHPGEYFYADQYKNDNNWKAHYHGTGPEIFHALPAVTHFVAGLGTTGSFVGTGRRLKKFNPGIRLVSLQPDNPLHGLEGWKHLDTAIVPGIYDSQIADASLEISTEEAYQLMRDAKEKEGLDLSPSSAANLAGAFRVAETLDQGIVVTLLPDNADKYGDLIKKLGL